MVNTNIPYSHGARKGDDTDELCDILIWHFLAVRRPFALFTVFTPVALLLGLHFCSLLPQFVNLAKYRAEE